MCAQQGRETLVPARRLERLVWRKMVLWLCSDYTKQPHVDGDCYIHFKRLICQIRIWCDEPSPAECTAMIAGTTARESVSTVIIWL